MERKTELGLCQCIRKWIGRDFLSKSLQAARDREVALIYVVSLTHEVAMVFFCPRIYMENWQRQRKVVICYGKRGT